MRENQEHPLLTIPEVTARKGVVTATIATAVRDGSLHSRRLFGRVVITEEDAEGFVIPVVAIRKQATDQRLPNDDTH